MLNSHKNIIIPPECGFAVWWYKKYCHWNAKFLHDHNLLTVFLEDFRSSRKIETWNLDYNKLRDFIINRKPESYSKLISLIYEFYGLSLRRKFTRWGDKNNFHLNHITLIRKIFPDSYFIHIVRDGRDVACSYIELNGKKIISKYAPKLPNNITDIALDWLTNIETIRTSFEAINWQNVIEIKYEELVINTESVLEKICTFIDEQYDIGMLAYHEKQNDEPKEFLQWKENISNKPIRSQVGIYKKELSNQDIDTFNSIVSHVLKLYKYEI